jgi:hypothetical protein
LDRMTEQDSKRERENQRCVHDTTEILTLARKTTSINHTPHTIAPPTNKELTNKSRKKRTTTITAMLIRENETNAFMDGSNEDDENWEMVTEVLVDTTTTAEGVDQPEVEVETLSTHDELPVLSTGEQSTSLVPDVTVETDVLIKMMEATTARDEAPTAGARVLDPDEDLAAESTPLLLDSPMQNTAAAMEPNETDDAPHDDASTSQQQPLNTSSSAEHGAGSRSVPLLDKVDLEERLRVAKRKIRNTVKDLDDQAHKIQETTVSGLKQVGASAKALGTTLRHDMDEHAHKIQETTVSGLKQAGASVKSLGETLFHETETVSETVKRAYVEHDVPAKAKAAAETVKETACQLGRGAKRFNDKYQVTDKIASAAIFVGALALAKGNHRGGASAMAVAGASFMAGEAMRSPAHASTELNENLHLD